MGHQKSSTDEGGTWGVAYISLWKKNNLKYLSYAILREWEMLAFMDLLMMTPSSSVVFYSNDHTDRWP